MAYLSLEEKVMACLRRHPDWTTIRVAKSCSSTIGFVNSLRGSVPTPDGTESTNSASVITLDKIVARYDIKSAILRELAKIPHGSFVEESEFCKRTAGTDRNRFRRTVENNNDLFKKNRIKVRLKDGEEGRWWWGSDTDIEKVSLLLEQ